MTIRAPRRRPMRRPVPEPSGAKAIQAPQTAAMKRP
jgi:hypothetical protein